MRLAAFVGADYTARPLTPPTGRGFAGSQSKSPAAMRAFHKEKSTLVADRYMATAERKTRRRKRQSPRLREGFAEVSQEDQSSLDQLAKVSGERLASNPRGGLEITELAATSTVHSPAP